VISGFSIELEMVVDARLVKYHQPGISNEKLMKGSEHGQHRKNVLILKY
jgi:hypothetical protein